MIKKIVIVGGGTAGWLCAGIIAADYQAAGEPNLQITLVESPDVSTIGVGEGTWPTMRMTLKRIGISETEFLKTCSASFKQGSKFVGWRNGSADDFYYHPFTVPAGFGEANIGASWKVFYPQLTFDFIANIQARVCEAGLAPKQITAPEYAGALNYGYHLDAGKFGELLKNHCVKKLGVTHILDHVDRVNSTSIGDIASLDTKEHGEICGDLFIDCTGTHCLLIGEHFGIPFVDCSRYSINDRAIAVQVPYVSADAPIASATIGTAQSAGWTWDIGLSNRRGVGYVYSSSHINEQQAHAELVKYLGHSVSIDTLNQLNFRQLAIKAGHREKFWHRNCVAVGMAAGFIEPLEASALALVELSASLIRDELPRSPSSMTAVAKRFNEVFSYRWKRIIEFLKLHYVLSERRDTAYWRDAVDPQGIPDGLLELLELWRYRSPYERDLLNTEEVFPSASYSYVLYGMGFETDPNALVRASFNIDEGKRIIEDNFRKFEKYAALVPSTRNLLTAIEQYGLKKV